MKQTFSRVTGSCALLMLGLFILLATIESIVETWCTFLESFL